MKPRLIAWGFGASGGVTYVPHLLSLRADRRPLSGPSWEAGRSGSAGGMSCAAGTLDEGVDQASRLSIRVQSGLKRESPRSRGLGDSIRQRHPRGALPGCWPSRMSGRGRVYPVGIDFGLGCADSGPHCRPSDSGRRYLLAVALWDRYPHLRASVCGGSFPAELSVSSEPQNP
jgi:hypothetical protein